LHYYITHLKAFLCFAAKNDVKLFNFLEGFWQQIHQSRHFEKLKKKKYSHSCVFVGWFWICVEFSEVVF